MEYKIKVIGTGPGSGRYITPIALEAIAGADILVGGQRLLDVFAGEGQIQFPLGRDLQQALAFINEHRENKRVAVLVSGDTGIYSFADYLSRHMDNDFLEFIPGISSVQLMFARLKKSWHDALILSMHGRKADGLAEQIKDAPVTALLTGEPWTPRRIAQYLLENNINDLTTAIGQNLSYDDERIIFTSLQKIAEDNNNYDNSIMVIFNER